jgi:hypothetical protein
LTFAHSIVHEPDPNLQLRLSPPTLPRPPQHRHSRRTQHAKTDPRATCFYARFTLEFFPEADANELFAIVREFNRAIDANFGAA